MLIESILAAKGDAIIDVSASDSLEQVAQVLSEHRIGAVLVQSEDGSICGVLSERDIVRAIAREGAGVLAKPAEAIMTRDVITCSSCQTAEQVLSLMTENRIRHLPVVDQGQLRGMISIGDAVKYRIEETLEEAQALRSYIVAG